MGLNLGECDPSRHTPEYFARKKARKEAREKKLPAQSKPPRPSKNRK